MEIYLNKEENTETSQFINFSIREYVAGIRKKNPAKCWPFKSLRHPDIIGLEDTTELAEAPNLSKVGICNGKEDRPETTTDMIESFITDGDMGKIVDNGSSELTFCKVNNDQNRHENNVDEGANIRHNVAADNNDVGITRPQRKTQKFRLLSDIYKDSASELHADCDRTNPKNVNKRFATEIEDESDDDDVTLAAYFRKQKGVESTDFTLKKKWDAIVVEEPAVHQDGKSNPGSKDSIGKDSKVGNSRKKSRTDAMDAQTMPEHEKDYRLKCSQKSNRFAEVSKKEPTEKENEDFEMEAVMLLARHFNEKKQILHQLETNTTFAFAKKKIQECSTQSGYKTITKTSCKTTKQPVRKITKEKLENICCSVQMRSFTPAKATIHASFQSHVEMSMMKIAGVGPDAQNCATLVCSFNRNPADFSVPTGENKFMREG